MAATSRAFSRLGYVQEVTGSAVGDLKRVKPRSRSRSPYLPPHEHTDMDTGSPIDVHDEKVLDSDCDSNMSTYNRAANQIGAIC